MIAPRYLHTATLLKNNFVLLAPGDMGPTANPDCSMVFRGTGTLGFAESYDPAAGTFAKAADFVPPANRTRRLYSTMGQCSLPVEPATSITFSSPTLRPRYSKRPSPV